MGEVGKLLGLRCTHCGGPLPKTRKKLIECRFCGTTVRVDDASEYLAHLKGFVIDWIRTALPRGLDVAHSASIDPVARHNIFVQNVSPNLNAEFSNIQFGSLQCFSTPLIVPPFVNSPFPRRQVDPKTLFSFNAKLSSVRPLAVDQDDDKTVQKMDGLSRAFAHVLIALDLIEKTEGVSYKIVAENFAAAANALHSTYETQNKRMTALAQVYLSIDDLLSKKITSSRKRVDQAMDLLKEVKLESALDINLSICVPAIEQELEVARTVSLMVSLAESSPKAKLLEIVGKVENLLGTISRITARAVQDWRHRFQNMERYGEIMKWVCKIFEAKQGKPTIRISSGTGHVLFPFWAANIKYTFSTGSLWMRKGRPVSETALIAATFPAYLDFAKYPSAVVTDIFKIRPSGPLLSSITGKEASISTGKHIEELTRTAVPRSAMNYKAVPPLTSTSEAEQLMNNYLQQVSASLRGKLQIASSEVTDLIFVPAELTSISINFHATFGLICPREVGDIQLLNAITIL